MSAYKPEGRSVFKIKVPTQRWEGEPGKSRRITVKRTADTRDPQLAREMQRMVNRLKDPLRAWEILARVEAGTLRLAHLFDLWKAAKEHIPTIERWLNDVPLAGLVDAWAETLRTSRRGIADDTADRYEMSVRALLEDLGADAPVSRFTADAITEHLDGLELEPGTIRKRGAGIADFGHWMVRKHHVDRNPMESVELPAPGKPRDRWLTVPQVITLADRKPEPYRTLDHFLAGTGADLSTAIHVVTRSDVDLTTWRVRLRGTKSTNRDRFVTLAGFARDVVKARCAGRLPHARLFDDIPHRWAATDAHAEARTALEATEPWVAGYWLRDHRHTWAVRMAKAGAPMQVIAEGLGNTLAMVVSIYSRYAPTDGEKAQWEAIAATMDQTAITEAKQKQA